MKNYKFLALFLALSGLTGCSSLQKIDSPSKEKFVQPTGFFVDHEPSLTLTENTASIIPVQILAKDDYAVIPDNMPNGPSYPKTISIYNAKIFANQIAAYGGGNKVWIGPQGWSGEAETGADGSTRIELHPSGQSLPVAHITYYVEPGCMGCMLNAAARYFPNAAQEYKTNFDSNPVKIPQGLKVTTISPTLVTYSLPDSNGFSTQGVAFYQGQSEGKYPYYIEATFVLPKNDENLSKFLQQTFIQQEKLQ